MKWIRKLFCEHKKVELIRERITRDLWENPYENCTTSYKYETEVIERCMDCWKFTVRNWCK